MATILETWGGRSTFEYEGSVTTGTLIRFGRDGWPARVSGEQYAQILAAFRGQMVNVGTSRDRAPEGSLGAWMQQHITRTALASYVAAILVHEGYAERVSGLRAGIRIR